MALIRLSEADDWRLARDDGDIRGWPVCEPSGDELGEIVDFVVDADHGEIEAVVLDTGRQYPASDLRLEEGRAYLDSDGLGNELPELRKANTAPDRAEEGAPAVSGLASERPGTTRGFVDYDGRFRQHHHATYGTSSGNYTTYEPAYRHGYEYGGDPEFRHREYSAAEPELRRSYEQEHGADTFDAVQEAVEHAYEETRRGRTVSAGEAATGEPRGTEASETVGESVREDSFRRHYRSTYGSELDEYDLYRPAYQYGYRHGTLEEFREQQYEEARPELRRRYEEGRGEGSFDAVEEAIAHGFGQARE